MARIEQTRDGKRNSSAWGERMVGRGLIAEQIRNLFRVFRGQHGLDNSLPAHNRELFRPVHSGTRQRRLF